MNYKYIKKYQDDHNLINSYHDFTQTLFGFDLIDWRNAGHWRDKYIPHSFIHNGCIIANISVSIMQLQIMGKDISAIQLGSVGVLPGYRGKGLSRILMEKVLEEYNQFPLILLFANDSVLDFYPKFGFRRVNESGFTRSVSNCWIKKRQATKISKDSEILKRLLDTKLQRSSIVDARENESIYWFHLLYNFYEDIFYIEEKDIIFIAKYTHECVIVYDVLSSRNVNFDEIREYIQKEDTKLLYFYFTPDWLTGDYQIVPNEDDAMYVYGEFPGIITSFKFPITAHT